MSGGILCSTTTYESALLNHEMREIINITTAKCKSKREGKRQRKGKRQREGKRQRGGERERRLKQLRSQSATISPLFVPSRR